MQVKWYFCIVAGTQQAVKKEYLLPLLFTERVWFLPLKKHSTGKSQIPNPLLCWTNMTKAVTEQTVVLTSWMAYDQRTRKLLGLHSLLTLGRRHPCSSSKPFPHWVSQIRAPFNARDATLLLWKSPSPTEVEKIYHGEFSLPTVFFTSSKMILWHSRTAKHPFGSKWFVMDNFSYSSRLYRDRQYYGSIFQMGKQRCRFVSNLLHFPVSNGLHRLALDSAFLTNHCLLWLPQTRTHSPHSLPLPTLLPK